MDDFMTDYTVEEMYDDEMTDFLYRQNRKNKNQSNVNGYFSDSNDCENDVELYKRNYED